MPEISATSLPPEVVAGRVVAGNYWLQWVSLTGVNHSLQKDCCLSARL
jgi:hypothetical protein